MKTRVIITTSAVVDIDCADHDEGSMDWNIALHAVMDPISSSIWESVGQAVRGMDGVAYPGSVSYLYCDAATNLYTCHKCGGFFTDRDKPDQVLGIPIGRTWQGKPICDECECWTDMTSTSGPSAGNA